MCLPSPACERGAGGRPIGCGVFCRTLPARRTPSALAPASMQSAPMNERGQTEGPWRQRLMQLEARLGAAPDAVAEHKQLGAQYAIQSHLVHAVEGYVEHARQR